MWTVKNTNGDVITNNCGAVAVAPAGLDGFVTVGTTNLSIETNDLQYATDLPNAEKDYSWTFAPSIDGVTIAGADYTLAANVNDPCAQTSFTVKTGLSIITSAGNSFTYATHLTDSHTETFNLDNIEWLSVPSAVTCPSLETVSVETTSGTAVDADVFTIVGSPPAAITT